MTFFFFVFEDMSIYFSGDDVTSPVTEFIEIPWVKEELDLKVRAYGTGSGVVDFSWSGIEPCSENFGGCEACETYPACKDNLVPGNKYFIIL